MREGLKPEPERERRHTEGAQIPLGRVALVFDKVEFVGHRVVIAAADLALCGIDGEDAGRDELLIHIVILFVVFAGPIACEGRLTSVSDVRIWIPVDLSPAAAACS